MLLRTPSGRGLSAGGGGLQRGVSEKGVGLDGRKNGALDTGIKRQASEKMNLTPSGKFQPASLVNERKPSGKFSLDRQASVGMGNSTSGKSNGLNGLNR